MNLRQYLRNNRGAASLFEVLVMVTIVAITVPGILGLIALSNWNEGEARALLHSFPVAMREIEWLQATCKEQVDVVLESASYDPEQPIACDNYPKGLWRDLPDTGVPKMRYKVDIGPVEGEEENVSLAQVKVRAEWDRAFVMRARGSREYLGYLFGTVEGYWEFYPDWSGL